MQSKTLWLAIIRTSARELLRSKLLRSLFVLLVVFSWIGLAFPVRLGRAGPVALDAVLAVQVLASVLFAGVLVALPMNSGDWPWSSAHIGALPLAPRSVVLAISLGQAGLWLAFWLSLVLAQCLGLVLQWAVLEIPSWDRSLISSFLSTSLLVLIEGLWLQALARFIAAILPGFIAVLALLVVLIVGHFLGSQPVDSQAFISWFRPGFEYLSQGQLLSLEGSARAWAVLLALSGCLGFNLLCAWILGWRLKGLAELDPKTLGD